MCEKRCTKCNEVKPMNGFLKNKTGKDGLMSECRKCFCKRKQDDFKTVNGLIGRIYSSQKTNSKNRGDVIPNYSKEELKQWILLQPNFNKLYEDWAKSGHAKLLKPSCDRLNDYLSYTLDNLRLITWGENEARGNADRKAGINNKKSKSIIQLNKVDSFIANYFSSSEAQRNTNINQGNIIQCCKDNRKSAGGYKWMYADEFYKNH